MNRSFLCITATLLLSSACTWAGGTLSVRLVGGRLCARCSLSANESRIAAQVVLNLGGTYGVALDPEVCTILGLATDTLVTLDFQSQGRLGDLPYRTADLSSLKEFTAQYASELEEIPVLGLVGLGAFGESGIRLDIQEGSLVFGPMAEPGDGGLALHYTETSGQYRLAIEPMAGYVLRAGFTTAGYETRIDAVCAALADRPGGNFERCMVGPLNLSAHTAIRPVEGLSQQLTECEALIGNSLWQDFVVQIDPLRKTIWLQHKPTPQSDLDEQQYYVASAEDDLEGMEWYLKEHPQSRLAREAALTLLTRRVQGPDTPVEVIQRAVQSLRQTVSPKDASAELLTLADSLGTGPSDLQDRVAYLLDEASRSAQQTTDAALLGRDIEVRRGSLALARGDVKQAHLHLLSALFGQPDNPVYNYWMARCYEAKGQKVRAWSRYLRASLGDKAVSEAVAALERLTNDPDLRQDFSMQDAEDFLEGHVAAYHPADLGTRWPHGPETLVEAFLCVDNPKTTGASLALRALASEGVRVLCYHIHAPDPDPLTNPATVEAAKRMGIEETPAVLINGRRVPLSEDTLGSPDGVLSALSQAEAGPAPRPVTLEIQGDADGTYTAAASAPAGLEADPDRTVCYWVEQAVLLNSANQCWVHGQVVRGRIPLQDMPQTPGRLVGTVDPKALRAEHEAYARGVESERRITFRTIPTYVDVRRCSVVVKLYDRTGRLVAAGTSPL